MRVVYDGDYCVALEFSESEFILGDPLLVAQQIMMAHYASVSVGRPQPSRVDAELQVGGVALLRHLVEDNPRNMEK